MKEQHIITCRSSNDALVVGFRVDRINEFQLADRLGRELKNVLDGNAVKRVVFDFRKLEYVISEVFNVFIGVATKLKKDGCVVVACNLNPLMKDVYTTMRFDTIVPISKNLKEALKTQ
jgi:anti-anti-sigma regulatory factor